MRHRPAPAAGVPGPVRAARALSALALVAATVAVTVTDPAPAAADGTPTVEVAGSIRAPSFNGSRSGNNGVIISPDGRWLYASTFGYLLRIDLTTYTVERRVDLAGAPPGAAAVSADGTTAYVLLGYSGATGVQPLDLTTGVPGTAVFAGSTTNHRPTRIQIDETPGGVIAYVYEQGSTSQGVDTAIVAVDMAAGTSVRTSLTAAPFSRARQTEGSIALSGDGTELYLATPGGAGTPIEVISTATMTLDRTLTTSANFVATHVPDGATKGELFAALNGSPATLRVVDLDGSDAVTRTVTLGGATVRSMFTASDGSAAVAFLYPNVDLIPAGASTPVSTDFADSFPTRQTQANTLGVLIDANATHGTCIFASNNYGAYLTAFSVDGADCGPFTSRFGPLADVPVDGTSTMTIDPPAAGAREAAWVGVGVFVDGVLLDVVRPPFGSSIAVDWADVAPGLEVELRAYNQTHLDDAGLTDVSQITASTGYLHVRSAAIGFTPLRADELTAGTGHTCALTSGVVRCWGDNSSGQLGDGTTDERSSATRVADVDSGFTNTGVTAIAAGADHTCAIAGGVLSCWGDNGRGRLGDGTTDERSSATRVADVDSGFTNTGVTAVAAGAEHTCAIAGGVVYCWGRNSDGQLGDGTTDHRATATRVPDVDSGFTNTGVTAVAAGTEHTCAVASGVVYCWGANGAGQLGDDTTTTRSTPTRVVDVASVFSNAGVTAVAAGTEHSCAVAGGVLYCWGDNGDGQLGDDTTTARTAAIRVADVTDGMTNADIAGLSIGPEGSHTCALASSTIHCWGNNASGRIGDGTTSDRSAATAAIDVEGGFTNASVTSIAAGTEHTCAVAAGRVHCWGGNGNGQLGDGTTTDRSSAVGVCCDVQTTSYGGGGTSGGTEEPPAAPPGPPVTTGQGAVERPDGTRSELEASDTAPRTVRYAGDGLTIEVTATTGTTARNGLVTTPPGFLECVICATMQFDGVIEVRAFSTPRLLAAARVDEGECQTFTIPLATPLDGGGPLPGGAHTLQFALPTATGTTLVNIGMTVTDPDAATSAGSGAATGPEARPNAVRAGGGPDRGSVPRRTAPLLALAAALALAWSRRTSTGATRAR